MACPVEKDRQHTQPRETRRKTRRVRITDRSRIVEAHAKMIPGAKFVSYNDAWHVTSWDARDANVKDVGAFPRSAETR